MSEEEIKEKIELLKELLEYGLEYKDYIQVVNAFEDLKNLIKKQDKMIDLMTNEIYRLFYIVSKNVGYYQANDYSDGEDTTIEEIKEHFRKKCE